MKKIIVSLLLVTVLIIPASVSASQLSSQQISAILSLLQAFGASQDVINNVAKALGGTPTTSTQPSITSIYPSVIDNTGIGSRTVTVFGRNFKQGLSLYFGQAPLPTRFVSTVSADGTSFNFTVPEGEISLGDYPIKVLNNDGSSFSNSVNLKIVSSASPNYYNEPTPSVTITSPNYGTYTAGSYMSVSWKTVNVPSSFVFDIIRLVGASNGKEYTLAQNVDNGRISKNILIPSNLPVGKYQLQIKSYLNGTLLFDESNEYITIVAPSSTPLSQSGRLDNEALLGATLKAFNFLNQ